MIKFLSKLFENVEIFLKHQFLHPFYSGHRISTTALCELQPSTAPGLRRGLIVFDFVLI